MNPMGDANHTGLQLLPIRNVILIQLLLLLLWRFQRLCFTTYTSACVSQSKSYDTMKS